VHEVGTVHKVLRAMMAHRVHEDIRVPKVFVDMLVHGESKDLLALKAR
jgi:hypothetical protein